MSYYRATSPGSRRIQHPARASDSLVVDPYYPTRAQYASPRSSGDRVIPISTQTFVTRPGERYDPQTGTTGPAGTTSRSRRSTLTDSTRPSSTIASGAQSQSRAPVVLSGAGRQISPLPRPAHPSDREYYATPAISEPRIHKHKKLYSVDDGRTRLLAETDVNGARKHRKESLERGGYPSTSGYSARRPTDYHLSGPLVRLRDSADDDFYSYTDAAGMYRETEPRWRPSRHSSVGGSRERTKSIADGYGPRPTVREAGPPPTTRGLDRFNDGYGLTRAGSTRDAARSPVRASQYQESGYRTPQDAYEGVARASSTRQAAAIHQEHRRESFPQQQLRDPRDTYDDRRSSRDFDRPRPNKRYDRSVERRGFGIRSDNNDRYGRSSDESFDPRDPRPIKATVQPLDQRDYNQVKDTREEARKGQERLDYEYAKVERAKEFDQLERAKERERDRDRDRDYRDQDSKRREKDRSREDRDDYDRRDYDRDKKPRDRDREKEYDRTRDYDRDRERRDDYERRDRGDRDGTARATGDGLPGNIVPAAIGLGGLGVAAAAAYGSGEVPVKPRDRERERDRGHDASSDDNRAKERARRYRESQPDLDSAALTQERERERQRPKQEPDPISRASGYPPERPSQQVAVDPDEDYRRRLEQVAQPDAMPRVVEPPQQQAAIDPDEDYRRRLEQAMKETARAGTEPAKQDRRDVREPVLERDRDNTRREREDRYRDKDVGIDDTPVPRELRRGGDDEPGRYDLRHNSVLDQAMTAEPAEIVDNSRNAARENRVRIVEPPSEKDDQSSVKGILKQPKDKFPEHPNPIREGVAPLKDASKKGIPPGARWTKIDRRLVNPEALEKANERFEERLDCVIVLRVLTKEDIQKFADKTRDIRDKRYEEERDDRHDRRRRERERSRRDNDEYDDDSVDEFAERERPPRMLEAGPSAEQKAPIADFVRDNVRDRDGHRDRERERDRERA